MTSSAPARSALPKRSQLPGLALKLGASLVLAGACAWILRQGALRFVPEPDLLATIDYSWLAAYLGMLLLSHFARAARWRFLLAPVGKVPFGTVIRVAWIGFGATVALP